MKKESVAYLAFVFGGGLAITSLVVLGQVYAARQDTRVQTKRPANLKWSEVTFGFQPEVAAGKFTGRVTNLDVEVRPLEFNATEEALWFEVIHRKSGTLTRAKLAPFQTHTFSNRACAGYLYWHREQNVKPDGYAVLQVQGFCP